MFKALSDHLLTVDLKVAMTFEEWQKFFGLRCDSLDGFLPFYSSVRTSVTRLKDFKSEAIKDETFLRAFMTKALDVMELKTYTKEFLTEPEKDSMDILKRVH